MSEITPDKAADKLDQAADIVDAVQQAEPNKVGKNAGTWVRIAAGLARLFGKKG